MKRNVTQVVKAGLCLGCGICQDTCPKDCIRIIHGNETNYPHVENEKCIECSLCLNVCSGIGINFKSYSTLNKEIANLNKDSYLGLYDKCFSGYSSNNEIRYHSASGGCLSGFLIYLLDKNIIDGAVVVGWDKTDPMQPHVYIAKNKEEVIAAKSSKYCAVSYEGIIKEINHTNGKFVVVGLPCHIQSFRKYSSVFKSINNRIIGYFAIYCSSNRTKLSQQYLLYRYHIKKENVQNFAYRDNGCLGSMIFRDKDGNIIKSIPYPEYWIGMKGFFNIPRCSLCIDHYGELSNISFGDLHVGEFKKDKVGISSIISRSPYWSNLLKKATEENYLRLEPLSIEILKSSQRYAVKQKKGPGIASAFKIRSLLHRENPQYDVPLLCNYTTSTLVKEIMKYIMRFIGSHRQLWFIIKILDCKRRTNK